VTFLVERLTDIGRQLQHLRALRARVTGPEALAQDLSLHNDVLFGLLSVAQGVVDVAGELAGRAGLRFADYASAIRALRQVPGFPVELVADLIPLAGFRNILIHEYVELDLGRVIEAMDRLDPVERFVRVVADLEKKQQ
jgi:uncharacterized protein YutE (UPF0331/DUF86 family)